MRCRKQPSFLVGKPTPINEIWEVRIPIRLWTEIKKCAQKRKCTLSTITRFCAFALAERSSLKWRNKLWMLHELDKREYRHSVAHRHLMCLYGDDAKMLRLAAVELGISVSALIRLALRLYLRHIAMENQSKRQITSTDIFWKAIKRWIAIPLFSGNSFSLPAHRQYFYQSFPPEHRWSYRECIWHPSSLMVKLPAP